MSTNHPIYYKLREALLSCQRRIAFASVQSEYGLALEGLLPYTLLTTPAPTWQDELTKDTELIVSRSRATNTLDLLLSEEARDFLRDPSPLALLVFKGSFQIESICRAREVNLLSGPSNLSRMIENKLYLRKLLENTSVPLVPQEEVSCSIEGLERAKNLYGFPFVLQFAKGFSGNSSFLIREERDFAPLLGSKDGKRAKVSPFLDGGQSLTLNGCVLSKGVALSSPFLQITGLFEVTPKRLASCGNDWNLDFLSEMDLKRVEKISREVGERLAQKGFRGFFGLDLLWLPSGDLYLIEINPRFTGNLNLSTKIQMVQGEIPLLLLHMAEFMGLEPEAPQSTLVKSNLPASQVIVHANSSLSFRIEAAPQGGIYRAEDCTYLRKGHSYLDLKDDREFLLQPLSPGNQAGWGKELGRILWKDSVYQGETLSEKALKVVRWFREEMENQTSCKAA